MANIQSLDHRQTEYISQSIPSLGSRGGTDPTTLPAGEIIQALFNLGGNVVNYTFAVAATQYAIAHGLPYTPRGYIVIGADAAVSVYNGTTAWNDTDIYLEASAATSVTLMVF